MIFQAIVFLLIILCALYWAWQGAFSSTLMFIAAMLASALAIGIYEEFLPQFSRFRPDYAEPLAFFLIFALACSVLRLAGGFVAPRNIHLPQMVDLGIGGLFGFLTALIIFGTSVIGVEMLPGYQKILGFDRYPDGLSGTQANLWIPAAGFAEWAWDKMDGGSLGGESFTANHPDLTQELYGDRHVVVFGSQPVVPQNLFGVSNVFVLSKPANLRALGIPVPSPDNPAKILIVRSSVVKGDDAPDVSSDSDNFYRITPAEVRLVTANPQAQYFPIGYIQNGGLFRMLKPNTGQLVEDYSLGNQAQVVNDWVFAIPPDAQPRLFCEKEIARQNITDMAATATASPDNFASAGPNAYPPLKFMKDLPALEFKVVRSYGEATNQAVVDQEVYLVRPTILKRQVTSQINTAWDLLEQTDSVARRGYENRFLDMKNWEEDHQVSVSELIYFMLYSHESKSPEEDIRLADHFVNESILPFLVDPDNDLLVWKDKTDQFGKTSETNVAPGSYIAVTWVVDRNAGIFHFWSVTIDAKRGQPLQLIVLDDRNAYVRKVR